MKIVTTFHQPSSVLASLKCQLSSRDLEHLVVAKTNRIDVYSLQPHGLQHQCGIEIWGTMLTIKSVPISGSSRSNLLLLLGHPGPELVFLFYTETSSGAGELTAKKSLSLYERTLRPAEFFSDVVVHSSGKLAVISCYTGKLKIVTFKSGNHDQDFDVMLPELNLLGLAFLPLAEDEYAIAVLHLDYQNRVQLLARDILLDDMELSSSPSTVLTPTAISSKILPPLADLIPKLIGVPAEAQAYEDGDAEDPYLGGVLVVGGKKIMMYELASGQSQAKQRSKRRRLESKKKSTDENEAEKARSKEQEREARKRKAQGSVHWPWSEVLAICAIDSLIPRYLIGDAYGRLAMLSLENVREQGLILLPLGETSPPTTLTYLTAQTLYLGSHLGDSQILHISTTPTSSLTSPTLPIPSEIKTTSAARLSRPSTGKGKSRAVDGDDEDSRDPAKGLVVESKGSFVNLVETFKNIAPIVDAIMVDTDGSGERQIVTCSGGGNKGAINVIRNGADFQELASIPGLTDVINVWGVRDQFEDTIDTHILVSTLDATHLFRINDAGGDTTLTYVQETGITENSGLITNLPTLAFGNVSRRVIGASGIASYVNSQQVVQVTRKEVLLLECDIASGSYQQLTKWAFNDGLEVTAASVNPSQVILASRGGRLVALGMTDDNQFRVVVEGPPAVLPDISAISCTPLDPTICFSNYITVAYWGTNIIEIFVLDKKGFVSISKSAPLPALVRSVLLHSFGSDHSAKGEDFHPHLLAGLGDGSVVYFPWKNKQLNDKKVISLGHAPVSLSMCLVDGKRTVFAAGNRATVLTWEKKRIHSSPIMLKEIVAATRLNMRTFQSSLLLATPTGLFIGRVQDLDKMHVRSIDLGLDNPRRVAYEPNSRVFGVGITRIEPNRIGDPEWPKSSFRLLDDATFSALANFNCEQDEEVTAVMTYSPVIKEKPMPVFCVGTYTYAAEREPSEGRLLIFSAYSSESLSKTSGLQLFLVASADVKGAVYSLTIVNDMIVAAVMLYRLKSSDNVPTPSYSLELLSEWTHNYLVSSLASYGDRVVAGDKINSVSLLKVVNRKLQNIARDYGPLWPLCVEASDEENIIAANDTLNLFTYTLSRTLGRSVLERDGHYYLADLVTKFIRGSIISSDSANDAALEAKHIFFTSSGRIGVIIDVKDAELSLHLTSLQRNLTGVISGVGGDSHTRFRAPKNTQGRSDADSTSFGFIDGDFLEQFLTRLGSPEEVEKIIAGHSDPERLTMPVEEMQKVLENLQSMH
ncbi:hypothetical protein D9615_002834 [Tricholomella constricta]|uniref:DNA damage-binding protein 1 n=1 Tax=Tricholomella constricta TaxID=117010 RepID=A0A8H5M6J9_9AGAR|nr:hypothetical protein D9615_002834 [Tricholomella constricta]